MQTTPHKINLALQGGGSHGAFTWGVLDTLLEDGRVEIEGVSGTSAGAMNAAVIGDGLYKGGREQAREALACFWSAVSEAARFSPIQSTPWDKWMRVWSLDHSPAYLYFDILSRLVSPYVLNPTGYHPLRQLLEDRIDFEALQACRAIKLFISATCVQTGTARVFHNWELTTEVLLASACLPFLFQAVNIDGAPYWDGGYMGNPLLHPLINYCEAADIVIVQINPVYRQDVPTSAREIINRVNEISFNASLIHELHTINLVNKLVASGSAPERYHPVHLHCIEADEAMSDLGASSKMNADWDFLTHLRDLGRSTAHQWLNQHFDRLGQGSTLQLAEQWETRYPAAYH